MQVKNNSQDFRSGWFVEQFETGHESPNLDLKAAVYKLADENAQFEFVRDIIAFANVARRTNQCCWILFGVRADDSGRSLLDVRKQFPGNEKPKGWDNLNVHINEKQIDGVEKVLYEIAGHWISPEVAGLFALEYGELDGTFVSYLEIRPTLSSKPYSLKRSYVKKETHYREGTVFIRKGASTARLADSEIPFLLQWNLGAYLLQRDWQGIIQSHMTGEFEKIQNLIPFFHPREANSSGLSAFDMVMQAVDAGQRVVVIQGAAGSGKSVLLHRVAYALANRHNIELPAGRGLFGESIVLREDDEIVSSLVQELEVVPALPIPIFMTLRASFATLEDFENQLLAQIRKCLESTSISRLEQILVIPGVRWVLLFDGVDEIRNRREFAPLLRNWIQRLPRHVQVVVTSRPAYASFGSPETTVIDIEPLNSEESVSLLLGKIMVDEDSDLIKQQIKDWILQQTELLQVLACPRALDGLVNLLQSKASLPQLQIDQDRVEVTDAQGANLIPQGEGDIPFISVTPNAEQIDMAESYVLEDGGEKWTAPQLASALQIITTYMRRQEIVRRDDWGNVSRRIAEEAQCEITETAWVSDWETDSFDYVESLRKGLISRDSCEWNEDIGFIHYLHPRRYKYLCDLLQHYFCAEHAFSMREDTEIIAEIVRRGSHKPASLSVLNLLNQIRTDNGRTGLEIPKRRTLCQIRKWKRL